MVMSNRLDDYSGMYIPNWAESELTGFVATLHDHVGSTPVTFKYICSVEPVIYKFSDDNFYFGFEAGHMRCNSYPEYYEFLCWAASSEEGSRVVDCRDEGVGLPEDWDGFNEKNALAHRVTSRISAAGFGVVVRHSHSRDGTVYYVGENLLRFLDSNVSILDWFSAVRSVVTDGYYVTNLVQDRVPLNGVIYTFENSNNNLILIQGNAIYRDHEGVEVMLEFGDS